ncbi:Stp1/IreP family PP2C-type Ser/Thr phosphatase [Alkalicoccus halolimnae]|uniref:Stp1/IreP family PP2C-type Ser/Thr phosphatase n=1 Tax=Alkalicoccus halolimnae TaxID=1667239 RepID=A0A5C7FD32_9BACI|nr:Stp1/IreP family PP2C-type Ser/Thr phosphatase [Alkalicoccus halolimnae]TXF87388.1 Stp1/IreP family PP2C-type Ser/Thr phosphatase [Alkalicoccus halolimnae]
MKHSYGTDVGRVRSLNEDSAAVVSGVDNQILAVVADGMGGHQAGDTASRLACEAVVQNFEKMTLEMKQQEAARWFTETAEEANRLLFNTQKSDRAYSGMGTTLTAAVCDENFVAFVNVGDSRLYHISEDKINQISEDHSLVEELVRQGQLTKSEAEVHPKKNILTRALGTERNVDCDTGIFHWSTGDIVLLCTDGLTNKLSDKEILETIMGQEQLEAAPRALIERANERGGEDNITAAVVLLEDVKPS